MEDIIEYPEPVVREVKQIINALGKDDKGKPKRNIHNENYVLPRFQRGEVWLKQAKEDLIESIKRGWPIGSIMLARKSDDAGNSLLIIDGQQRIRTVQDYFLHPLNYVDISEISKEIKSLLFNQGVLSGKFATNEDELLLILQKVIAEWLKLYDKLDDISEHDLMKIMDESKYKILKESFGKRDMHDLGAELKKWISKYVSKQKIDSYKIPCIILKTKAGDLPQIFSLINTKGTKLNQYAIFASDWHDISFKIRDQEIMKNLKSLYQERMFDDEGNVVMMLDSFDPDTFMKSDINLYEYLLGFGYKLYDLDAYKLLFDKPDETGFKIFSVVLRNHLQEMQDLGVLFEKFDLKDNKKLADLQKKIEDTIDFVYSILGNYLNFPGNKKTKGRPSRRVFHPQTQIMAIIGTVFHELYDIQNLFNPKINSQNAKSFLKKNIPLHYIRELIREIWDLKHPEDRVEDVIDRKEYLNPITFEGWEIAFQSYKEKMLVEIDVDSAAKYRKNFRKQDVMFLNFLYISKKGVNVDREIEHLIPYDRLIKRFKKLQIKSCAINSVANLCLITKDMNNKKKDLTLFEFKDAEWKNLTPAEQTLLQYDEDNLICNKTLLSIKKDSNQEDDFDMDWYRSFLEKRFDLLKKEFYELYNIKKS